jgi:hypothetical protein
MFVMGAPLRVGVADRGPPPQIDACMSHVPQSAGCAALWGCARRRRHGGAGRLDQSMSVD